MIAFGAEFCQTNSGALNLKHESHNNKAGHKNNKLVVVGEDESQACDENLAIDDRRGKLGDGWVRVSDEKVGIARMADVLASEFAFVSGLRTHDGLQVLTFPDVHSSLSFEDYRLLISYLLINLYPQEAQASGPLPEAGDTSSVNSWNRRRASALADGPASEYVLVIDRRNDKWSAVRLLFSYITAYLPARVRVAFVLKPEGVLQRALEVSYRNVAVAAAVGGATSAANCLGVDFQVVFCQNTAELHRHVSAQALTTDVSGAQPYVHNEWVQHRMNIERMKSSAAVIAESLSEFGRCLRDTELPNDVETTARILELQTAERDAIKEDFRISIRKGVALLRQIRQFEQKPNAVEQLSPSRLHNVEAIERMLIQLEDTERSFDAFWTRHRRRLSACLAIRRYEDAFRKLQSNFAKHMRYLDEHRYVDNSVDSAERLAGELCDYLLIATEDVEAARKLRADGDALLLEAEASIGEATNGANAAQFAASCDSLAAKRGELARMADALEDALERRAHVLEMSRNMHACISGANDWCRRGMKLLLSSLSTASSTSTHADAMAEQLANRIDELLLDGEKLQLNTFKHETAWPKPENLTLLSSVAEMSGLLTQVSERINDIRRLSVMQRDALRLRLCPPATHSENETNTADREPAVANGQSRHERLSRRNSDSAAIFTRPAFSAVAVSSTSIAATMARAALRGTRLSKRPVQIVSPEKKRNLSTDPAPTSPTAPEKCKSDEHKTSEHIATPCAVNVPSFGVEAHASIAASLASTTNSCETSDGSSAISGGTTPVHAVPSTSAGDVRLHYILEELLNTEESYVNELESLIEFYVLPFEAITYSTLIPPVLRGQSDVIFGNIKELAEFHRRVLLTELRRCGGCVTEICRVLMRQRNNFLALYRPYCQNKPQSEALRGANENGSLVNGADGFGEHCKFFTECQRRAGHPLPLGAYLLKPIQRITKYQLLLRELSRCCTNAQRRDVDAALAAMLELLGQLNADMQQLHILGFTGDLRLFGPLRLQTECEVYAFKRKSRRLANKPQRRHIFLFDGGVLFCKRRDQQIQYASEYYEHKLCIPIHNLGFAECSKWSPNRFELWDESRNDGYAVRIADEDEKLRAKWIARLARLTTLYAQQQRCACRPRDVDLADIVANGPSAFEFDATVTGPILNVNGDGVGDVQAAKASDHSYRPQSWTSDGSCSMSSQSSVSAFDDTTHAVDSLGISELPLTAPPMCQSSFTRRRLSALIQAHTVEAAATDGENDALTWLSPSEIHITSIHIPASKSLQNAAIIDDTDHGPFGRHFHQLGGIAERRRQANKSIRLPAALHPLHYNNNNNNNKVNVGGM